MPGTPRHTPHPQPWRIEFFQRRAADDPQRSVPARDFLDSCPTGVRADFLAVLKAVAEAPPPRFGGGGKWEAMHGVMKGFYEIRITGPSRRQYRLFCVLDRGDADAGTPCIVLIAGMSKPSGKTFSDRDYRRIRDLGRSSKVGRHAASCGSA